MFLRGWDVSLAKTFDFGAYPDYRIFTIAVKGAINFASHSGKQAVRYASAPASWQYLRIYSPGGTCSGMLAY